MSLPHIYVSRQLFTEPLKALEPYASVQIPPTDIAATEESLIAQLGNAQGLICTTQCPVTARVIEAAPQLRCIANVGVGVNNIDLEAAKRRGIQVSNTPDVLTEATADLGWALLMAASRVLSDAERWMRAGHWEGWAIDQWLGVDVYQTTLGIFGYGRIGQALARRARGFNMRVIYHNRTPLTHNEHEATWVTKHELLQQADHIIVVMPLTDQTKGYIGAAELGMMQSHAILVNIGRGGIVDDEALAVALEAGKIAGAGLDVFDGEPLHISPRLLQAPRLVCTPHIGSATHSTRVAMVHMAVRNVLAFLQSTPLPQRVV